MWIQAITWIVVFISVVKASYNGGEEKNYDYYHWRPVSSPFGDRLKPIKKEPNFEEDKMYISSAVKPFIPVPYIQGLYTFPYYAYSEIAPVYQHPVHPYLTPDSFNYIIKKDNKDRIVFPNS